MTEPGQAAPPRGIAPEVIAEYRKIDTAVLSDVLADLNIATTIQGIVPLLPHMKICGPAATVRQVPAQEPTGSVDEFVGTSRVVEDYCEAGDVIVMECGGRTDMSAWGSWAALLAKLRGLEGAVIEGASRDTEGILELGWPVFSRSTAARGPHGLVRTVCINSEPIQLGIGNTAITVVPGDLVVGDRDAICVVPRARIDEVLSLAMAHAAKDRQRDRQLKEELPWTRRWPR